MSAMKVNIEFGTECDEVIVIKRGVVFRAKLDRGMSKHSMRPDGSANEKFAIDYFRRWHPSKAGGSGWTVTSV